MKTILFVLLIAFNNLLIASNLGKETYEKTCKTCHAHPIATHMKAPAAFDKMGWNKRFKEATNESKKNPKHFKTAIDYLLYRVSIGKGLMPHGGLCKEADLPNKHCSDEAIKDAIYYMAGKKDE